MKKKGYSVIELLIAMAIFLFGIFPILSFTFTSLRGERIAGSREEAARLSGTVVDYIKSRGYAEIKDIVEDTTDGSSASDFSGSYALTPNSDDSAFIVDTTSGDDFEGVFYSGVTLSDDIFLLNSRGLRLSGGRAQFKVYMSVADVHLYKWADTDGDGVEITGEWTADSDYENPITGNQGDIIFGGSGSTTGINTQDGQSSDEGALSGDKFILGRVVFEYSEKSGETPDKSVETQFIISPIEEWR